MGDLEKLSQMFDDLVPEPTEGSGLEEKDSQVNNRQITPQVEKRISLPKGLSAILIFSLISGTIESFFQPVLLTTNEKGSHLGLSVEKGEDPLIELKNGGEHALKLIPRKAIPNWEELIPNFDSYVIQGEELPNPFRLEYAVPPREPDRKLCLEQIEVETDPYSWLVIIQVRYQDCVE